MGRLGAGARRLAVDVSPLRASRDFRLLWFGEMVSETGYQMSVVAVFVQVFRITGSSAMVGLVGLVHLVPLIASAILGGPLVDRVDRRRLLIGTQVGFALAATGLLLGALAGSPPLGLIYLAVAWRAVFSAISGPTRSATIPNLVSREQLPNAMALNQVMWNTAMILGPAVGGIVIGRYGLAWAYGIDVIAAGGTMLAALLMSPQPPRGEAHAGGLAAVREGFAFLRGRRVLQTNFGVDLVAMIFGMPRALFPVLALERFHRGEEAVGALFSAIAVGALLGAASSGWVGRVRRQGRAVLIAVGIWGAGIAAFGLSGDNFALALACLAVAGAADVVSAVFRGTILQTSVPDNLRGRLSAMHILVVTGGPRLGDLEAGMVAAAFTPTISVVSGGLACIAGVGAIAVLVPAFARYRVDHDAHD